MKTIFVTIKEFIENGGILEKGREIYINKGDIVPSYYLEWDHKQNVPLIYNTNYKSFPVSMGFLVKIDVTPIYK